MSRPASARPLESPEPAGPAEDPGAEGFDFRGALSDTVREEWDRAEAAAERERTQRVAREANKGGATRAALIAVALVVVAVEGAMTLAYFQSRRALSRPPEEPQVSESLSEANRARDAMLALSVSLKRYAEKNAGEYPASLEALVQGGFADAVPADPKTGGAFVYEVGARSFSLAVADPAAYGVQDIRTTKDGVPVIALLKK